MDITVMIPTMNRSEMLLRLIRYYDSLTFGGQILIGDSSDADTFRRSTDAMRPYMERLNILHLHLPGRSVSGAIRGLIEHTTTGFVCLVPDDDFVVPRAMGKCIQFLEQHPEYAAAHGIGVLLSSSVGGSVIDAASFFPQPSIEEATAERRMAVHLEGYSVGLFSVHRKPVWKAMFADLPDPSAQPERCDMVFVDELLPGCLSAVYGRIKQIDELYLVRQDHTARYALPTWFAWITGEKWMPSYRHFRRTMASAISAQDGTEVSRAEAAVDRALSVFLQRSICRRAPAYGALKRIARNSTLIRSAWRSLRGLRDQVRPGRRISLRSLLSPASPFADDFAPVFGAVTGRERFVSK